MKPCPFCGHKKSYVSSYDGDTWRICRACRASTAPHSSARAATKAWEKPRPHEAAKAEEER